MTNSGDINSTVARLRELTDELHAPVKELEAHYESTSTFWNDAVGQSFNSVSEKYRGLAASAVHASHTAQNAVAGASGPLHFEAAEQAVCRLEEQTADACGW